MGAEAAQRLRGAEHEQGAPEPVSAADVAWAAVLPCALVTLLAIVLLGPPLGETFLGPGSDELWPRDVSFILGEPDPAKRAGFALALLGVALYASVVLVLTRRPTQRWARAIGVLATLGRVGLVAFLAVALLGQLTIASSRVNLQWEIFGWVALAAALVLAGLLTAALSSPAVRAAAARVAAETPARRIACGVLALACAGLWVLPAVDTEHTIGNSPASMLIYWAMDDPFAVLNGRTPLVDFHAMYAQLAPYAQALLMRVLGANVTVYSVTLATASALALLAVYATLRRVTRSSVVALALFVPFASAGFLPVPTEPSPRSVSNIELVSVWPLRYAGAYLMAWLTVRHLGGAHPRRLWVVFLIGGLVAINNLEFGVSAVVATLVALLCARPPRSWRDVGRVARSAGIGFATAVLIVVAFTLVRSGSLPDPGLMLEFPRLFAVLGLLSWPMRTLGLHLALYATFAAAIGVALVRLRNGDPDRLLTGMLAWTGTFGLLAGSYYVGRSDALKLTALLSPWALALGLLLIAFVRAQISEARRWPGLAGFALCFGFALTLCTVTEVRTPWQQLERLGDGTPSATYEQPDVVRYVAAATEPGERVAILIGLGHRVARDAGVVNISPYSLIETIVTREQWQTLFDAMRAKGARKLLSTRQLSPSLTQLLLREGFREVPVEGEDGDYDQLVQWVDVGAPTRLGVANGR